MICEGRILQKSEGKKTSIGVSMWKILDAMNYNRRLMIGKRDYDIILSKEDSEYDFFDKNTLKNLFVGTFQDNILAPGLGSTTKT